MAWSQGWPSGISSFVNMQRTRAGTHVDGLLDGLADAAKALARPARLNRRQARAVVEPGLSAVIQVTIHGDPRFGDPTKDRLDEPGVGRAVRALVARELSGALDATPSAKKVLLGRITNG